MILACVPLPAPGAPSMMMGPTWHGFCCGLREGAACPSAGIMQATPQFRASRFEFRERTIQTRGSKLKTRNWRLASPRAPAAYAPAARGEAFVVAHDQLRLNLLHRVHGDADHNQQ